MAITPAQLDPASAKLWIRQWHSCLVLMRLLLDRQIMLWWRIDDPCLRSETSALMTRQACVMSVASIWEVAIKHRLGDLNITPGTAGA